MVKQEKNSTSFFGFKKVDSAKKAGMVGEVFSSVAGNYDIMNDFMSAGLHRLWKRKMIKELNFSRQDKYLDVAGGTGDVAFLASKHTDKITVCDINQDMLNEGKKRSIDKNILNINWQQGNAEELPFEDNSFDKLGIAFGIRNVTFIDKALAEFNRVLKPGGKFVCLEFSHVEKPIAKQIYNAYSFNVIPKIGKYVANDEDSYQYLVESIRKFPTKDSFKNMIQNADFENCTYQTLNMGVVAIHSGYKKR